MISPGGDALGIPDHALRTADGHAHIVTQQLWDRKQKFKNASFTPIQKENIKNPTRESKNFLFNNKTYFSK